MSFLQIVLYAYAKSDAAGQAVIWVLAVFSSWAWSIMGSKLLQIIQTRGGNKKFMRDYSRISSPVMMGSRLEDNTGPLQVICQDGIKQLLRILDISPERKELFFRQGQLPRPLTQPELDKIRSSMVRAMNKEAQVLENSLNGLGTIVSLAPFLGLFGTVWGVMATFIGIAQQGRPELSAIAPGISGALLTTVAGLIVAIPSLIGCNYINTSVQSLCIEMEDFTDDFIASLQLEDTAPQQTTQNRLRINPVQQQPIAYPPQSGAQSPYIQ